MTSETPSPRPFLDRHRGRLWAWGGLAIVIAVALGLRLWGIRQGLPFVYNTDEDTLFVAPAVAMFGHSLKPTLYENPPALTYLFHFVLAAWFGGATKAVREYQRDPTAVYTLARALVAALGALQLWLLYLTGARLFNRAVGVLAAAIMAVAFLPTFYSHLALNDVPTLAPLTLSLWGSAGVLRRGRPIDYLIAGIGIGLASATKYTGGIVALTLIAAVACRMCQPGDRVREAMGLLVAGLAALVCFVIADPYSVLAFANFHAGITTQSKLSSEAQGKLGAPKSGGLLYYLWTFTWGLGWVPSLAALGGAIAIWRHDRRVGLMLVVTGVAFFLFMGLQTRYFGRWLLPIFPIACLLGAFFTARLCGWLARLLAARQVPRAGPALTAAAVLVVLAQGIAYSVHSDVVLSRPYTAEVARRWMVDNVPAGTAVVLEPVVPNAWLEYLPGSSQRATGQRDRWIKLLDQRYLVKPDGEVLPNGGKEVSIEDYERTLSPALIPYYERRGYCLVITGSTQSGRARADPSQLPEAIAYYKALAAHARIVYRISPYRRGDRPVAFSYDWSFDYYPLAYLLPGPELTIYRLDGGRCAVGSGLS